MFQPVPNGIKMVTRGVMGSRDLDVVNVFYANLGATPLTQAITDAFSVFFADFYDDVRPYFAVDVSWTGVELTDVRTVSGPQFVSTSGFPKVGTSVAESLADFVAIRCDWRTALRGPWYRGRSFLTGLTTDGGDGNSVAPAAVGNIQEAQQDLIDSFTGTLSVCSRRFDKAPRAAAVLTPITSGFVGANLTTLRGRMVGS